MCKGGGGSTGYLDGPVAGAFHLESYPLPALVERDEARFALDSHDGTRLVRGFVDGGIGQREHVVGGDGQEGAVQGLVEVAIVGADGMVDGDEVGASREGALDHQLGQGRDDRGKHMAAAEHGFAHGHEVGNRVVAIADQLGSGAQQGAYALGGEGSRTSWRLFAIRACSAAVGQCWSENRGTRRTVASA